MDEVTRAEIERLRDEDNRQNKRLELLERNATVVHNLALSIEKLAMSVEAMAREQTKHSEKIAYLEAEPAKKWGNMTKTIFNNITGAASTAVAGAIIWALSQYFK